jgi:hypothetical protein
MKELCPKCVELTAAKLRTGFVLLGACELCGVCTEALAVVVPRPTEQMRLEVAA